LSYRTRYRRRRDAIYKSGYDDRHDRGYSERYEEAYGELSDEPSRAFQIEDGRLVRGRVRIDGNPRSFVTCGSCPARSIDMGEELPRLTARASGPA